MRAGRDTVPDDGGMRSAFDPTASPVVLGLDAAWTSNQPSGVALAAKDAEGWRLVRVAASYGKFQDPACDLRGSLPDAAALLGTCVAICGRQADLVAVDMPLSHEPITARRASDNAVSSAYGGRKCGTHSPSAARPGKLSDDLRAGFATSGYRLLTDAVTLPGLVEVYPHPALVELAASRERLRYKLSRAGKNWPGLSAKQRREQVVALWEDIAVRLDREIAGVCAALAVPRADAPTTELKAHEDMLDAVVCAWVGICVLEGRARPYGDSISAIWVPQPRGAQAITGS